MTEPERIADALTEAGDLTAAGCLVAMVFDDDVVAGDEQAYLEATLTRHGCLDAGRLTPTGRAVGMVLHARGITPLGRQ